MRTNYTGSGRPERCTWLTRASKPVLWVTLVVNENNVVRNVIDVEDTPVVVTQDEYREPWYLTTILTILIVVVVVLSEGHRGWRRNFVRNESFSGVIFCPFLTKIIVSKLPFSSSHQYTYALTLCRNETQKSQSTFII